MPFIKVSNKKKEVYTTHQTFELFLFVSVEGSGHLKFYLKSPKQIKVKKFKITQRCLIENDYYFLWLTPT